MELTYKTFTTLQPERGGYETCAILFLFHFFDVVDVVAVGFVMVSVVSLFNLELQLVNFPLMPGQL